MSEVHWLAESRKGKQKKSSLPSLESLDMMKSETNSEK
jgi:hypothetical protein